MPAPVIECPGAPSDTGAYRIEWTDGERPDSPDGGAIVFRLLEWTEDAEEALTAATILYEGEHSASTVTGRASGTYVYQVGRIENAEVAAWSKPCEVLVHPPGLGLAMVFFSIGLVVTLSTVGVVVRGHRAHRRGEIG